MKKSGEESNDSNDSHSQLKYSMKLNEKLTASDPF